jgi:hypothetical protein
VSEQVQSDAEQLAGDGPDAVAADPVLDGTAHRAARELTDEAMPVDSSEAELVAAESEVLATCLASLVRLPRLRREAVWKYVGERVVKVTLLEVLQSMSRETVPVIERLQSERLVLIRENAELKAEFRKLKRAAERGDDAEAE